MKNVAKKLLCLMLLVVSVVAASAQQSSKELKKDLKMRVEKECRKDAKSKLRAGWSIMPGALPLDRQLMNSRFAMLETNDEDGEPLYMVASFIAKGGTFAAAKTIAHYRARTELAANVNTHIREMVKKRCLYVNYAQDDVEAIDQFVSVNTGVTDANIRGTVVTYEVFREVGNIVEVEVFIKVNRREMMSRASEHLRAKLKDAPLGVSKSLGAIL